MKKQFTVCLNVPGNISLVGEKKHGEVNIVGVADTIRYLHRLEKQGN